MKLSLHSSLRSQRHARTDEAQAPVVATAGSFVRTVDNVPEEPDCATPLRAEAVIYPSRLRHQAVVAAVRSPRTTCHAFDSEALNHRAEAAGASVIDPRGLMRFSFPDSRRLPLLQYAGDSRLGALEER